VELQHVLRRLMKERKLTFKRLAATSGVKDSTLKDWANGVAPRDLEAVRKVAVALGVSFEFLCFGAETTSMTPDTLLEGIPTQLLHAGWVKLTIEMPSKAKKNK
jgi:transcriptional regulator with XRE-family HTH domain